MMIATDLVRAIRELPREQLPSLLIAIAAVMSENQPVPDPAVQDPGGDDESLTIEEASTLLRRSTKWLYRHREQLPFIRKIGPRSYLVSRNALNRWLARQ